MSFLLVVIFHFVACFVSGENNKVIDKSTKKWGLLVAGSNGWYNYRHQADICHSYQIMHNHGIPDENIVVMMYDDIANNNLNPTPGKMINHPYGPNVYKNVPKDYTGDDVTPENFLNVLQGNKEALKGIGSGKVINSTADDHIFVYFSDHGGTGILAFPDEYLYAIQINYALFEMWQKKQYGKMVIYIEACESGSIFRDILLPGMSIWATTASNRTSSSYACYYDKLRNTYLGDWYSVNWMEDSDRENLNNETLRNQYLVAKAETYTSTVEEFGDIYISTDYNVGDFQGSKPTKAVKYFDVPPTPISTWDVEVDILKRKIVADLKLGVDRGSKNELNELLQNRSRIDNLIRMFVKQLVKPKNNFEQVLTTYPSSLKKVMKCHMRAMEQFREMCPFVKKNHQYMAKYSFVFANLCQLGYNWEAQQRTLRSLCSKTY